MIYLLSPVVDPFEDDFVETRDVGDVCVAVIDERVLTDHQVEAAKHRLFELADAHAGRLAISLSHADGSSLALFAALMHVQHRCASDGGKMVLFDIPPLLAGALSEFGLGENFTSAHDLKGAVDAVHGIAGAHHRAWWLVEMLGLRRAA